MKLFLSAALCSLFFVPPVEGNDIVDFLKAWRDMQREYEQRYDRWDQFRSTRRHPDRERRDQRPPTQTNPQQIVGELHNLARDIQPYVTVIANSLDSKDDQALRDYSEGAEDHLFQMIAAGRDHDRELFRHEHQAFDENWQQLLFRIQNYKTSEKFDGYVAYINNRDRRIHQLLHQQYRPGFETRRLARLATELERNVDSLVSQIEQNGSAWDERPIYFQARRVARQADDFAELAQAQSNHALLTEEFRKFDDDWHTLTYRLRRYGPRDMNLHSEIAAVRNTDRELHQVLFVEAPIVSDNRSVDAVLERAQVTADELVDVMREAMWRERLFGHRRVIGYLLRLRDAIDEFDDLPWRQQTEARWRVVSESWLAFKAAEKDLPADQLSPTVASLQKALDVDMAFLSRRFDSPADTDWRYGSTLDE